MASRYRERLLQSSGVSNIRFESEYAKKLMSKMGWKEGNGLGKNQHGAKDCIQVRRREDGVGLGKGSAGPTGGWKDDWWNDAYNNSMKKLVVLPDKFKKKAKKAEESSSSEDDSSDESSNSGPPMPSLTSKKTHPIKKQKHHKKQ